MIKYTKEEDDFLIKHYPNHGKMWCCKKLNKTESSIRYRTSFLKLKLNKNSNFFKEFQIRAAKSKVGKKRPAHSILMKKYCEEGRITSCLKKTEKQKKHHSILMKKWIAQKGHPKGMLGKNHTNEFKIQASKRSKEMWANPLSKCNSKENRQRLSDLAMYQTNLRTPNNCYSRCQSGHYDINGVDYFFRSKWEANYALYLDFLIKNKNIQKWEFEKETFWFEKIIRGVRSYKPDFKIYNNNGTIEYHEVKGWMDDKSKTKLKRMKKYYPKIKLIVIDNKVYTDIKKKLGKMLKFF